MSLGIVFKGPEGLVLAADSRVTLNAKNNQTGQEITVYFDNATKLLTLTGQPFIGIITYGVGAIGQQQPRTAHSFVPELEAAMNGQHGEDRLPVEKVAQAVSDFYSQQWAQAGMPAAGSPGLVEMEFLIAGFDEGDPYGRVFEVKIPSSPAPVEQNAGTFGVVFGGQTELVARLIGGVDQAAAGLAKDVAGLTDQQRDDIVQKWRDELGLPIPYQFLPLQDCVDLTTFLVYMTTAVQGWTVGLRGVGGDVDVATLTRTDGLCPIQQKTIRAWE